MAKHVQRSRALLAVLVLGSALVTSGCGGGNAAGASSSSSSTSSASSSSSSSSSAASSSSSGELGYYDPNVAPNNPDLRYTGRMSLSSQAAEFDWANVQIEFMARANTITLKFDDGRNDYNVFVDDVLQSTISTQQGTRDYPVNLGSGDHHVRVTKRTGPNFGSGRFLGMELSEGGRLLTLPEPSVRKIEFIGDSHTVGYGNEGPGLDCGGNYRPFENSYLSFAAVAARALDAQAHLIAVSGLGAVRNYGDSNTTSATPMPHYYNRRLQTQSGQWDFQSWVPDAVVIKLGTNDYSTQPEPPASVYIQGIHGLIEQVNDAYGILPVFLVADDSLSQPAANLQTARDQQRNMGNDQVHFVEISFPPQQQLGCDWHPAVAGAQVMADELVSTMRTVLGW